MQLWRLRIPRIAPVVALLSLAQTDTNTTNMTTVTVTTTVTLTPEHHYTLSIDANTVWMVVLGVIAGWLLYRLGKAII
ncbi:hypothetical protein [Pyrodictium delaneyi]|uniref:Uncharacterized protein n=1 Tax=Pyrodictium delaneyi TaxID=1273541 RepID=A0A211YMM9_9CREN|nr:hypothetical protein [Pyrodictium delaneyi]OWJ54229.1 hypothetical protein Pdsh_06985 [Pyrodictium delaneyi]